MKSLILAILFPVMGFCAVTVNNQENYTFENGNSSKSYLGTWGNVLGTVVSPNQFLTATHVGGSIGNTFTFGGLSYTTTAVVNNNDLALWTFDGVIENYARISYDNPLNKDITFWGNGVLVDLNNPIYNGGKLYGYNWAGNEATRWANNTITSSSGTYLRWKVNFANNKGGLTGGDSGGGVFNFNETLNSYELIGVNYGVAGSIFGPHVLFDGQSNYATSTMGAKDWLINNVNIAPIPEPKQLFFAGLLVMGVIGYLKNKK